MRLLIFMQEKLADMKAKFVTKVAIKIKPSSTTEEEDTTKVMPQFKVFVNDEMGMAKQMVVRDKINQMVAVADHISRGSDTQADFYASTLSNDVKRVALEQDSDMVIGLVGEACSGKFFTLFGIPQHS